MTSPFDPIPRLATYLHPSVCPDHAALVGATDCPVALDAARHSREELLDAGLAVMPIDVVSFVETQFRLALGSDTDPASADADGRGSPSRTLTDPAADGAGGPPTMTADLYRSPTLLVCRRWDGSEERLGPWARPLAEAILVDFNWTHDPEFVAARLEPEAVWIGQLLDGLDL